jgi:hypothetical protein
MIQVHRGVIEAFHGSWMSGLATLVMQDGRQVHCENAPTVRALEACYGNVIAPGHTVDQDGIRGKEIAYSMDEMGLTLAYFTPIDEWLDRGVVCRECRAGFDVDLVAVRIGTKDEIPDDESPGELHVDFEFLCRGCLNGEKDGFKVVDLCPRCGRSNGSCLCGEL